MVGKATPLIEQLMVLTVSVSLGLTSSSWAQAITSERPIGRPTKPPPSPTSVPYLFGRNRIDASALALAAGLKPVFYGPNVGAANVASQSIASGTPAQMGTIIQLQMTVGPQMSDQR